MKIARIAAIVALLVAGGAAFAVNPGEVDIYATMAGGLSISLSSTAYDFGPRAANGDFVSATGITITNDSGSFVETLQIGVDDTNGYGWTLAGAKAPDVATMSFLFNSTQPGSVLYDAADMVVPATPKVAGVAGGNFAGSDQEADSLNPADAVTMWTMIGMPTTDTSAGAKHQFDVTITAILP